MDFKLVECPKCKKKQILWFCHTGTTCSCGLGLLEDTKENRKEIMKENAEFAGCFNTTFEDFSRWLNQIKSDWNKKNAFVPFNVVSIPDERLIELVKGYK